MLETDDVKIAEVIVRQLVDDLKAIDLSKFDRMTFETSSYRMLYKGDIVSLPL